MARRTIAEAIILRTIDVGEADRLCVLFTREAGRKAGRARSVRKPGSRLGGTLLPFRHITVELSETENHVTITGAIDRGDVPVLTTDFASFLRLEQGVELLLALTEDDEPLPGVFELLLQFMRMSADAQRNPLPPFRLRLLHLLGLLPAEENDMRFGALDEEARAFVTACTRIADLALLADLTVDTPELDRFVQIVTHDQLQRPLKSVGM